MTSSAPHAGNTRPPDETAERPPGGPWTAAGPDESWWRGEPGGRHAAKERDIVRYGDLIRPAPAEAGGTEAAESRPEPSPESSPESPPGSAPGPATSAGGGMTPEVDPVEVPIPEPEPATAVLTFPEPFDAGRDEDDSWPGPVAAHLRRPMPTLEVPATEVPATTAPRPAAHAAVRPAVRPAAPANPDLTSTVVRQSGSLETHAPTHTGTLTGNAPTAEPRTGARTTAPVALPAQAVATDDGPFWMPVEEVPRATGGWPTAQPYGGRSASPRRDGPAKGRVPRRQPRRAGPALVALVLLSLSAAFFGWVSAEPLWLAVGHGELGTATVNRCSGSGIAQRCTGRFTAADGAFAVTAALVGVADDQRRPGTMLSARMVNRDSPQAYVGDDPLTLHLRWGVSLLLVLLCGLAIVWATGATRLETRRARWRAVLASLVGPLLLALGFLAASW